MREATIFSRLDFRSGYYQIPLAHQDREKTAFAFGGRLFHFRMLPFGLSTAGQTFARLMEQLFGQLKFCQSYVDDIIVFSESLECHFEHLEAVFKIIAEAGLTLNLGKCKFLQSSVKFLGFIVEKNQIRSDPEKTAAIRKFPTLTNVKQVRSFLGLVNQFNHLIDKFADLTAPLFALLRKNKLFQWSQACNDHFIAIKAALASTAVVCMPDLNKPFIVRTDASEFAMTGVLLQEFEDGKRRVIEYYSKKFTDCQLRYSTIEKEATAVCAVIEHWSHYLWGREFQLETDHRPLLWLNSMKELNSKLGRMALRLEEFKFSSAHIAGKNNADADALSRIELAAIDLEALQKEQSSDASLYRMRAANNTKFREINNILYFVEHGKTDRVCVPRSRITQTLAAAHGPLGHWGFERTLNILRSRVYWPGMKKDVEQWIKKCQCSLKKLAYGNFRASPLNTTV